MKALLLVTLSAGILAGCAANPFTQFYYDNTTEWPIALKQRLLPPSSEPQVIASSNIQEDGQHLEERGFVPIGFAGFRGGLAGQQQLLEQARRVGADIVLYGSKFSHTERGVVPWLSYQPGQAYTTQTYGTYGSGTYSAYSTTMTPGTYTTEYIPYQRQVFDQGAVFWRRIKPGIFGARFASIPDELRTKLERNTGVFVAVVVEGGPAFLANVMRGDVITQVADKPVATVQELTEVLSSYAGQKVTLKIIRNMQPVDIDIQLNPTP